MDPIITGAQAMKCLLQLMTLGAVLFASAGSSAHAEALSDEEAGALLNDTTWKMGVQRTFAPNRVRYWDWRADGSVCGRLPGLPRSEPCTSIGTWLLEGNRLCWRFEVLIEYRTACFRIERFGEGQFDLINATTNNQVYTFVLVK